MKIAYVCSDIDVEIFGNKGCSVHVREFCNSLIDMGHEVCVLCAWAGESADNHFKAPIYCLKPGGIQANAWEAIESEAIVAENHLIRDLRSVLWNSTLVERSREILTQFDPDIIYERESLFGWGGLSLQEAYNIPLILEVNAPSTAQQLGYEKFTLPQTAGKMEKEVIRRADCLVVLTTWLRDWIVEMGVDPSRVHLFPSAVSERLFSTNADGKRVRQRFGLDGKQVVGFVGGFHHWHDLKGLLMAFAGIHNRHSDARLLLVGSGDLKQKIKKLAERANILNVVTFAGQVPHGEMPEYIAAMDVAIAPYKEIDDFYFSPMKVFEYMAVGTPTIAAALGDVETIVEDGITGWLYSPGDTEDLERKIEAVLTSPTEHETIRSAARKRVLENHTWHIVAENVVEIAKDLINKRPSG